MPTEASSNLSSSHNISVYLRKSADGFPPLLFEFGITKAMKGGNTQSGIAGRLRERGTG